MPRPLGYECSAKTKQKMREMKLLNWQDPEYRKKICEAMAGEGNSMFGYVFSEETRAKRRVAVLGELNPKYGGNIGEYNPNWKGGIGSLPYPYKFNNEMKERIRERDNYTCQLCGMPQAECIRALDVHHIDYDKENLADDNLITLCNPCNIKANYNRNYWQNHIKQEANYGAKDFQIRD